MRARLAGLPRLCWYAECGRGFLANPRQPNRRYCSDACARLAENRARNRANAKRKEARDAERERERQRAAVARAMRKSPRLRNHAGGARLSPP